MPQVVLSTTINTEIQTVFDVIANPQQFCIAIPHIQQVEFLTELTSGVGTRFRETRIVQGQQAVTELEVMGYGENEFVRIVSDTAGTKWDSLFTVTNLARATELKVLMEAKPYKLAAKLGSGIMMGVVKGLLEQDLAHIKRHCELA